MRSLSLVNARVAEPVKESILKPTGPQKHKNKKPDRLSLSAQDIRDRVELNTKKKNIGPAYNNKVTQQPESAKVKDVNTDDYTLPSDVGLNDPNDSNTKEKLKMILAQGAFKFSGKEQGVLAKILNE